METSVMSSKNNNMQFASESEVSAQIDHMIGFILRNMYDQHGKNYSYEEIKEILKYKNDFIEEFRVKSSNDLIDNARPISFKIGKSEIY